MVGFGPEEGEAAKPVEQKVEPKPVIQEQPKVSEPPKVQEQPKAAPERQTAQQPKIEREPAVERKEPVRPAAAAPTYKAPEAKTAEVELEETRQKVASTVERGFFSFGRPKAKEQPPVREEVRYTPPVSEPAPVSVEDFASVDEEPIRPPFIRPGATVIAAGATFFGDIRAEGDVEVLGKVKGNLEATGNIRVAGKVLGDVKGEAVMLEGCTVQGNITSTSFVSLDAGAMVVGDVLATDFESNGKVKGNLQIARSAAFSSCALLAGNVIAATIMMSQGAKVQGAVRIAEDPEANALFGDLEI